MCQPSKNLNKLIFGILLAVFMLMSVPNTAIAAVGCSPPSDPPTLDEIVCPLEFGLTFLIFSAGAVFIGIIFYGSVKYALSQGDPKGLEGAKLTLTWGLIGFLIVIGVITAVNIVMGIFGASVTATLQGQLQGLLQWLKNNQIF